MVPSPTLVSLHIMTPLQLITCMQSTLWPAIMEFSICNKTLHTKYTGTLLNWTFFSQKFKIVPTFGNDTLPSCRWNSLFPVNRKSYNFSLSMSMWIFPNLIVISQSLIGKEPICDLVDDSHQNLHLSNGYENSQVMVRTESGEHVEVFLSLKKIDSGNWEGRSWIVCKTLHSYIQCAKFLQN